MGELGRFLRTAAVALVVGLVLAPAATPRELVEKISADVREIVGRDDVKDKLDAFKADIVSGKIVVPTKPGVDTGTGSRASPPGALRSSPVSTTSWQRGALTATGAIGLAIARIQASPMSLTSRPMPMA